MTQNHTVPAGALTPVDPAGEDEPPRASLFARVRAGVALIYWRDRTTQRYTITRLGFPVVTGVFLVAAGAVGHVRPLPQPVQYACYGLALAASCWPVWWRVVVALTGWPIRLGDLPVNDGLHRPIRLVAYSLIPFCMALVGAPVQWAMRLDVWTVRTLAWGTMALALAAPLAAILLMATGYRVWWGVRATGEGLGHRGDRRSIGAKLRRLLPRRKAAPEPHADANKP